MADISFADQPQLESFLRRLGEEYGQYAEALWEARVRRPEQLANARIEDLVAAGITPLHASDSKTRSGEEKLLPRWRKPRVLPWALPAAPAHKKIS